MKLGDKPKVDCYAHLNFPVSIDEKYCKFKRGLKCKAY